jgi:hypothetical protein
MAIKVGACRRNPFAISIPDQNSFRIRRHGLQVVGQRDSTAGRCGSLAISAACQYSDCLMRLVVFIQRGICTETVARSGRILEDAGPTNEWTH